MSYSQLCKGRASIPGQIYLVTLVTEARVPWFSDLLTGRLVVRQMLALHKDEVVESLAWVLMPDHLHWLIQLGHAATLPDVMQRLKGRSAKAINETNRRTGTIWQRGYYDHALRNEEDLFTAARYVVANPLRARLVSSLRNYSLWDAKWISDELDWNLAG